MWVFLRVICFQQDLLGILILKRSSCEREVDTTDAAGQASVEVVHCAGAGLECLKLGSRPALVVFLLGFVHLLEGMSQLGDLGSKLTLHLLCYHLPHKIHL